MCLQTWKLIWEAVGGSHFRCSVFSFALGGALISFSSVSDPIHAADAQSFTKMAFNLVVSSDTQANQDNSLDSNETLWRIAPDDPVDPLKILLGESKHPIRRQCIYFADTKLKCRDLGFGVLVPAPDGNTAIVIGQGNSDVLDSSRLILALRKSGETIYTSEKPGHGAVLHKIASGAELVVAAQYSKDSLDVSGIGFDGTIRWSRSFPQSFLSLGGPDRLNVTSDGLYTIVSAGRTTYVLDKNGQISKTLNGPSRSILSPNGKWFAVINNGKAAIYDLAAGNELFNSDSPPPGGFFACNDISPEGTRLLISEVSRPTDDQPYSAIERIHIVDVSNQTISTNESHFPNGFIRFEGADSLRVSFAQGSSEVYRIRE